MTDYIPFAQRPGWEDLTPIPQADAPDCLVPIAYSTEYNDAMSTFRALLQHPPSARALPLTEQLIRINPGHYSIWAYRLSILFNPTLNLPLSDELDLLDQLVKAHLKSYQVWQHRKEIVLALGDSKRELPFTQKALEIDAKNYHTWAYRSFILLHFFSPSNEANHVDVWKGELAFVDELLEKDIRNNSAWNHRFFTAFEVPGQSRDVTTPEKELEYVKAKLLISPNNPSAWNYLRGLLKRQEIPLTSLLPFVEPLTHPPSSTSTSASPDLPSHLAIEFKADVTGDSALWRQLEEFDPIRKRYWRYRAVKSAKATGVEEGVAQLNV